MTLPPALIALLGGGLAGITVGVTTVISREVVTVVDPASLTLARYGLACLLLLPFAGWRVAWPQVRPVAPRVALIGVFQFGVLVGLLNLAVVYIPSALATILFSTIPVATLLVAVLLGQERPTRLHLAGIVLTVAGVVAALGDRAGLGPGDSLLFGALATFGSVLTGAVCNVTFRKIMAGRPPIAMTAVAMAGAAVALTPLSVWQAPEVSAYTAEIWIFLGIIGGMSAVAFSGWVWALKHAEASAVASWLAIGPIVAALLDRFVLGVTLGPMFALGLALVVAGLVAVTRGGRKSA
ncbi:MAG: DMT family transporter [Alphaproteobacteria bacterium]|nr:DMT family transporter [Alphaproteobacteria bacterium]